MNQKGFANIVVIGIVLAVVLGVGGYFVIVRKIPVEIQQPTIPSDDVGATPVPQGECPLGQPDCVDYITNGTPPDGGKTASPRKAPSPIPSSPTKLDAGAPAPPADQTLAEITILSQAGEEWKIRVDKIRDYIRYPAATNPQLKVDDTVSIRFNGWLDTFQSSDKVCPAGYTKSPKPSQAESTTQSPSTRPQPQIIVGQKYLSKLFGCFAEIGGFDCGPAGKGWSGWLYNPAPIIIDYDCVKQSTTPLPSVEPRR